MLRILGAVMIISGSLGLGLWYRQQFISRLQTLRELEGILELFMSEIRYGKSTLPECCLHLAARLGEPYAQAFRDVFEEMQENTGAGFSEVFCRHMEECLAALPVKKEDGENFLRFISKSSYADESMQLRTMEMSRELLAGAIERVERENEEKCRLAVGLGAMSGLLLVIVLL